MSGTFYSKKKAVIYIALEPRYMNNNIINNIINQVNNEYLNKFKNGYFITYISDIKSTDISSGKIFTDKIMFDVIIKCDIYNTNILKKNIIMNVDIVHIDKKHNTVIGINGPLLITFSIYETAEIGKKANIKISGDEKKYVTYKDNKYVQMNGVINMTE